MLRLILLLLALSPLTAYADALCKKSTGAVYHRTSCGKKEINIAPSDIMAKTQTGIVNVVNVPSIAGQKFYQPQSYAFPLKDSIDKDHAIVVLPNQTDPNCPASYDKPSANPGYLCVYIYSHTNNVTTLVAWDMVANAVGSSKQGFTLAMVSNDESVGEYVYAYGSWAVTQP